MKKWLALMLVLVLGLCCTACANDMKAKLDGLSQEELVALDDQITKRLRELDLKALEEEGTPVLLVPGIYEVGKDIPEGKWKLQPSSQSAFGICMASQLAADGTLDFSSMIETAFLKRDSTEHEEQAVFDLQKGTYLEIIQGAAMMMP